MSNRPIGTWGRPVCVSCGADALPPVDTSHGFRCPRHAEAMQWFWDTAQSLVPSSTMFFDRSEAALLGGVHPCPALAGPGGLGYVWEILRVSFVSVLFRLWTRASICAQHDMGQNIHYESRHIILSTIGHVRAVSLLDARRASCGSRSVLRDGSISESDRFLRLLESSWIQSGFISRNAASGDFVVRFSNQWPIAVDLTGLQRIYIPSSGRSTPAHNDFTH